MMCHKKSHPLLAYLSTQTGQFVALKDNEDIFHIFRILGSFCYVRIVIETLHYRGWQNSEEADRAMAQPTQILVRLAYQLALPIF